MYLGRVDLIIHRKRQLSIAYAGHLPYVLLQVAQLTKGQSPSHQHRRGKEGEY